MAWFTDWRWHRPQLSGGREPVRPAARAGVFGQDGDDGTVPFDGRTVRVRDLVDRSDGAVYATGGSTVSSND